MIIHEQLFGWFFTRCAQIPSMSWVKVNTDLQKKNYSNKGGIFYFLFLLNTPIISNAAMCVRYSRNQLGACGYWWIFDERMDPHPVQVEYCVRTHSHMQTLTDTVMHRYTHTRTDQMKQCSCCSIFTPGRCRWTWYWSINYKDYSLSSLS